MDDFFEFMLQLCGDMCMDCVLKMICDQLIIFELGVCDFMFKVIVIVMDGGDVFDIMVKFVE